MRTSDLVRCKALPCADVQHGCYCVPGVEVNADRISIVLISEASPPNLADWYYATGDPLFQRTTVQAFNDAGAQVTSIQEILDLGVYLTTAVKCGKQAYSIDTHTIMACSLLLERELALFSKAKVYLLMGDVAIKAVNAIARRNGDDAVIPTGATYKLRDRVYVWRGIRVLPSYLQAGPSYFIEKSKRKMIAEDIATALRLAA